MEVPVVLFEDLRGMHGGVGEGPGSGFERAGEEIGTRGERLCRWEVGGVGGEGGEGVEEWWWERVIERMEV